jgi:hypothetical protein
MISSSNTAASMKHRPSNVATIPDEPLAVRLAVDVS